MAKELYDNIQLRVEDLLNDIKTGKLGLPDLQRPFVWKDAKARDLLDSMFRGYPIGYVMIWAAPDDYDNIKQIGNNNKSYKKSEDLVIDGQQRLTSLLASIYGIQVKDKNYKTRPIKISFDVLNAKFEVWSNKFTNNPYWINDISTAFAAEYDHKIYGYRKEMLKRINEDRIAKGLSELSDDEEGNFEENLNALLDLKNYTLPILKIRRKADEEDVADIFKRVNSGGQNLNENNFIETLLSVYDNDMYDIINKFCSDSRVAKDGTSYNQIIDVDPSHLIRMCVGYGLYRARMSYGYKLLRGKDLKSGEISDATREQNMQIFREALAVVTDLNNWHAYLNLFARAGYLKGSLVSSNYIVVYGYVWYLLGKYKYKVKPSTLQSLISRFIFMGLVTQYYAISPESAVEHNFADLRSLSSAEEFVDYFNNEINSKLTTDFFNITLPDDLHSSSAISPSWFAYLASINVLGYPMLFSTTPLSNYWLDGTSGKKKSIDKHHIFPKHYLKTIGFTSDRDRNQIANFTFLDYNTNIDIKDNPPADYVQTFRDKLGEEEYLKSCEQNALPIDFEKMDYLEFLSQRRVLMAQIVLKAYKKLSN